MRIVVPITEGRLPAYADEILVELLEAGHPVHLAVPDTLAAMDGERERRLLCRHEGLTLGELPPLDDDVFAPLRRLLCADRRVNSGGLGRRALLSRAVALVGARIGPQPGLRAWLLDLSADALVVLGASEPGSAESELVGAARSLGTPSVNLDRACRAPALLRAIEQTHDRAASRAGSPPLRRLLRRRAVRVAPRATRKRAIRREKCERLALERRAHTVAGVRKALLGDGPVLVGPFFGEVGHELQYWIPYLRWLVGQHPEVAQRLVVVSRGGTSAWYRGICSRYVDLYDLLPVDDVLAAVERSNAERGGSGASSPSRTRRPA